MSFLNSPILDTPVSTDKNFVGFKVEGLRRDLNFADVPDGEQGLTNILTNAFGETFTFNDISIVNEITTTNFDRKREYKRLYGVRAGGIETNSVLVKDTSKVRNTAGDDVIALPLQTINDQFEDIIDLTGSPSGYQGGDGLIGNYYEWNGVYGIQDEVVGTTEVTVNGWVAEPSSYSSPAIAFVQGGASLAFAYTGEELNSAEPILTTKDWHNGFWNFGELGPIPDTNVVEGIVRYKGYFNPGSDIGTFNSSIAGKERGNTSDNRLFIVEDSAAHTSDLAKTTIPVIWKFWELDSEGDRLSDSPTVFARYAPKMDNGTPAYDFFDPDNVLSKFNDTLHSPATSNNVSENIGTAYVVAPRFDDTPSGLSNIKVDFKTNTFYETELYFIISPRVASRIKNKKKTVFLAGYDRANNRLRNLNKNRFWSANPLKSSKPGKLKSFLDNSIPLSGTRVNQSPAVHSKQHGQTGTNGSNYRSLLSNKRIISNYKPPKIWSDVDHGSYSTTIFKEQAYSPRVFPHFIDGYSSDKAGLIREEGNLVIDLDSPNTGAFDTFTYVDNFRSGNQAVLTKDTVKAKESTTAQFVDHRGLKGYGKAVIKLNPTAGSNFSDCPAAAYLSPSFYHGESPSYNDIIIFKDYNNSPYIRVFDTSGPDNKLMISTLSKTNSQFNNVIPFKDSPKDFYHLNRNNSPIYFVYHYKGIVDKSLDGFCTLESTGNRVYQAIVAEEATTSNFCPRVEKDTLISYDGDFIGEADTPPPTGLLGLFADYNGTDNNPLQTIVRKALDGRLPKNITIASASESNANGTYELDQYGSSPTTADEKLYIDISNYEASEGKHYYRLQGVANNAKYRLHFRESNTRWELTGPTNPGDNLAITGASTIETFAGGEQNEYLLPSQGNQTADDGTGLLTYNTPTTAQKNIYTLILNSPNSGTVDPGGGVYNDQNLTSTLKAGFGITLHNSPYWAARRFQCFPPTDTAPPFRATDTGLRTIPSQNRNRVINSAAKRVREDDTPVTSIEINRLKLTGDYSSDNIVQLTSGNTEPNSDRKIKFTFKNKNGVSKTFSILTTTDGTDST